MVGTSDDLAYIHVCTRVYMDRPGYTKKHENCFDLTPAVHLVRQLAMPQKRVAEGSEKKSKGKGAMAMAKKSAKAVGDSAKKKQKQEQSKIASDEAEGTGSSDGDGTSSSTDEEELHQMHLLSEQKKGLAKEEANLESVTARLAETKKKTQARLEELRAERNKWPSEEQVCALCIRI